MNNNKSAKSWAIVPAAGVGKRMFVGAPLGAPCIPKQYQNLSGKSVLEHTLTRLNETKLFENIVLVTQPNDGRAAAIASLFPNIIFAAGGSERCLSVRNALLEIADKADPQDLVFVHDAVRPCVRPEDIIRLYKAIENDPVGGLLATPMRDTVKLADGMRVEKTIDRSVLWQAQTPQAFRYGILLEALVHTNEQKNPITDEAAAVELLGHQPLLVEGSSDNIKITVAQDLLLAQTILEQQEILCA